MELKEFENLLEAKVGDMKKQVEDAKSEINKEFEAKVAQINEDAHKANETAAEVLKKVNELKAESGKMKIEKEASQSFTEVLKKEIANHWDGISNMGTKGYSFELKANGDMNLGTDLTGAAVATYTETPALRGRRKYHFRDIPGVQVVPSATGIWKFYQNNVATPTNGSFGVQTEAAAKAGIDYPFTEKTVNVQVLAGFARVSRQMIRDLPFIQGFLPGELQEDYLRAEDNNFINALMAGTGAYTTTATVYAEKLIEWIGVILSRDYNPTAIVTTAANWTTLLNTKPVDYSVPGGVTITPMGEVAVTGVPVIVQNGITTGKTFVGDFSRTKIIQSRGLNIGFYEQDSDNVQRNLVTVRAEAEVALAVLRSDWGIYA